MLKKLISTCKDWVFCSFRLLWTFKWYAAAYLFFYCCFLYEYFNPPAENDPIWNSEAMGYAWNYENQTIYLHSLKSDLVSLFLLFLVGTSNMRNHPTLAIFVFLLPWLYFLFCFVTVLIENV